MRQNNRTCMPAYISRFSIPNFKISNLKFPIFLLATLCCVITIPKVSAQTAGAPKTQSSAPSAQSPASPASSPASLEGKVKKYLRNMYGWGPQYEIKLGSAKPTPIPNLLEISVTVDLQGQSDTAIVYVTKDGKYIFRGEL